MITAKELIEEAKRELEVYCKNYAVIEADLNWPQIAGIMSAQAATRIREAAHIFLEEKDSVGSVPGHSIVVYRNGRAASIKGSIVMSRHHYKALLREMVEDWIGDEVQDWSRLDLSGLGED